MAEGMNFWSSKPIDLEKYKIGSNVARRNNGYGACGCIDCQNLKALRDEILAARNGPTFFGVTRNARGVANKVKMSLVVDKPGIYNLEPIKKQTDGRFTSVYFPNPGKYSFVSIYKAARNAAEGIMLIDDEILAALGGNIPDSYSKAFKNVFVMGELVGDSWNQMKDQIRLVIEGVEIDEPEAEEERVSFEGVFMVNDRFIPCFRSGGYDYIITGEDGSNKQLTSIPGLPSDDETRSKNYLKPIIDKSFVAYQNDPYGGSFLAPFAYDTETHSVVTGIEITDAVWHLIKNNKGKFRAAVYKNVEQKLSPGEMAEAIRTDFARNGAASFTITEFYPTVTETSWTAYNPGDDEVTRVRHPCYLMAVAFEGKPLIGNNGNQGGQIYVRFSEDDNRPRLVWSSWCQRVSSWSKNVRGITDQKYDIWPLADWLSGPFAERCNLVMKEAPLLFCGNKATNAKKNALDKLRARLNKIR